MQKQINNKNIKYAHAKICLKTSTFPVTKLSFHREAYAFAVMPDTLYCRCVPQNHAHPQEKSLALAAPKL